jgi:hypothetical protein
MWIAVLSMAALMAEPVQAKRGGLTEEQRTCLREKCRPLRKALRDCRKKVRALLRDQLKSLRRAASPGERRARLRSNWELLRKHPEWIACGAENRACRERCGVVYPEPRVDPARRGSD